jgi:long-chain acyl-CoA synthetase
MKNRIFITGGTGNLGAGIILRFLENSSTDRLILLIRADSTDEASARLRSAILRLSPDLDFTRLLRRVKIVCGDITQNDLGLSRRDYEYLTANLTHIIHSAAATKFGSSLENNRKINYYGTKNIMTLAQKAYREGQLKEIAHISTAYVCGGQTGTILEDNLNSSFDFSNTYEQSKWEAECYVRSLMPKLPVSVYRPSIIVGDSKTGTIINLSGIYIPLMLIYRGIVTTLPSSPDIPLDVVSLDYVSSAIVHILMNVADSPGRTYHLVAGEDNNCTTGEIVGHALEYFNRKLDVIPPLHVDFAPNNTGLCEIKDEPYRLKAQSKLLARFIPHLTQKRYFDDRNTTSALKNTGIAPQKFTNYMRRSLGHCLNAEWKVSARTAA